MYPYAKLTADKLTQMDATMAKLKTDREKKKYFKIVEKYLEEEFEPKLKKLSRKDGQILVKLINRQTGVSTYNLIKEYKSGWKAFWANSTARLFSINLKTEYRPYEVKEDYHIEGILTAAFDLRQLEKNKALAKVEQAKAADSKVKYTLQAGSFKNAKQADQRRASISMSGLPVKVLKVTVKPGEDWYRVVVGPFTGKDKTTEARQALSGDGIDSLMVKQDKK